MKLWATLFDRVYRGLLSTLLPSFDEADAEEAVATFHELAADARKGGILSLLGFWGRESKSLFATAADEWKRRSEQRRKGNRDRASLKGNERGSMRLDHLNQDLRYALRRLAGSPGFVLISVISLSLAIAVSTVAFSVVNAAFFRPIPHVVDQDELVRVFTGQRSLSRGPNSFPDFEDYRAMSSTLEDMAAVGSRDFSVGQVSGGTRQLWGLTVSENFFQFMGIPLARGRGFLP